MAGLGSRWILAGALLLCLTASSRADNLLPEVSWDEPLGFPQSAPQELVPFETAPAPTTMRGIPPLGSPAQFVLPPPQGPAENLAPPPPVNGTWRDDGQYVIIDVNGQQLRLLKSALAQPPVAAPPAGQIQIATGSIHGRLLQHGRPLVNCNVVIVPMHNDGANDDNGIRHPLAAITDSDGIYAFENVPVGSYKLTWLPVGTNQWIRRIEMKPDVFVREGQDVTLKDIRTALRTIN